MNTIKLTASPIYSGTQVIQYRRIAFIRFFLSFSQLIFIRFFTRYQFSSYAGSYIFPLSQ